MSHRSRQPRYYVSYTRRVMSICDEMQEKGFNPKLWDEFEDIVHCAYLECESMADNQKLSKLCARIRGIKGQDKQAEWDSYMTHENEKLSKARRQEQDYGIPEWTD